MIISSLWHQILSQPQLNHNSTQPKITKVGFDTKMTLHHHHHPPPPPPPPTANSMSAISQLLLTRFWWNFKGSFLGASRTDFTIKLTFVQATFVLATISQLLMTWFWWKITWSFLEPPYYQKRKLQTSFRAKRFWDKCHCDIYPCNICQGDQFELN